MKASEVEPFELPLLACNGCTICCEGDRVQVIPSYGDRSQTWETERINGKTYLAHREGSCVYLEKCVGCKIHPDTPIMCQVMDCRVYYLAVSKMSQDEQKSRYNPQTSATLNKGQKLIEEWINGKSKL